MGKLHKKSNHNQAVPKIESPPMKPQMSNLVKLKLKKILQDQGYFEPAKQQNTVKKFKNKVKSSEIFLTETVKTNGKKNTASTNLATNSQSIKGKKHAKIEKINNNSKSGHTSGKSKQNKIILSEDATHQTKVNGGKSKKNKERLKNGKPAQKSTDSYSSAKINKKPNGDSQFEQNPKKKKKVKSEIKEIQLDLKEKDKIQLESKNKPKTNKKSQKYETVPENRKAKSKANKKLHVQDDTKVPKVNKKLKHPAQIVTSKVHCHTETSGILFLTLMFLCE